MIRFERDAGNVRKKRIMHGVEVPPLPLEQAKKESLELWSYLAAYGNIAHKADIKDGLYYTLREYKNECPLCEALMYRNKAYVHLCGCGVPKCPLTLAGHNCMKEGGSHFQDWFHARRNATGCQEAAKIRREAAQSIVDIIKAWEPCEEDWL
jgi:hypothetical protein